MVVISGAVAHTYVASAPGIMESMPYSPWFLHLPVLPYTVTGIITLQEAVVVITPCI
jgi:hypothetical protein